MAAKDTKHGMATAPRHVYGPRPLAALVPQVTRPTFRKHAPAAAQVLADWDAIVGPALAAVTTPLRLTSGTLTIGCVGPVAMELQHLSGELISRINTHLGSRTVQSLRFAQTLFDRPLPPLPPPPSPEAKARAEAAVADLPEGELRTALAALGQAVLEQRSMSPRSSKRSPSTPSAQKK
jgi:hypothetical protein